MFSTIQFTLPFPQSMDGVAGYTHTDQEEHQSLILTADAHNYGEETVDSLTLTKYEQTLIKYVQ